VNSYSSGLQEYDFEIDDSFFAHCDYGGLEKGNLQAKVKVLNSDRQIQLDIHIWGNVELLCDRCLDGFNQEVDSSYVLYGKFGHGTDQEDLDTIWIPDDKHYIDMAPVFYEYIMLSLPLKNIHPTDGNGNSQCNKEMINRLDNLSIDQE